MSFKTLDITSNTTVDVIEDILNSPLAFSGQLSLGLELSNKLTLDNFITGQNKAVLNFIRSLLYNTHTQGGVRFLRGRGQGEERENSKSRKSICPVLASRESPFLFSNLLRSLSVIAHCAPGENEAILLVLDETRHPWLLRRRTKGGTGVTQTARGRQGARGALATQSRRVLVRCVVLSSLLILPLSLLHQSCYPFACRGTRARSSG